MARNDCVGKYWSILQQGAGLANIGKAVSADSYILMDENATSSYADGKVKVELGDDPQQAGSWSFSFTIHNLTDAEKTYDLSADLFTQALRQEEVKSCREIKSGICLIVRTYSLLL